MAKKYDNEFKVMIVGLLQSGLKVKQVSVDYNLTDGMIRRWRREYEAKSGDFTKKREVTESERELKALHKELRDVKMERDILKKAVSIFSKSDN